MEYVFTVVGECQDDPTQLLVTDAEGRYYAYHPARERLARVAPDGAWTVFGYPRDGGRNGLGFGPTEEPETEPAAAPR